MSGSMVSRACSRYILSFFNVIHARSVVECVDYRREKTYINVAWGGVKVIVHENPRTTKRNAARNERPAKNHARNYPKMVFSNLSNSPRSRTTCRPLGVKKYWTRRCLSCVTFRRTRDRLTNTWNRRETKEVEDESFLYPRSLATSMK